MVNSSRRNLTGGKSQVSNGMVDLPLEIISDILIRLPIESIMSCRVVCKSWYGLTQDPNFINMHLSRSNYQPNRIILHNYTGNHLLLLDTEEHKIKRNPIQNMLLNGHQVMCSCNGLLCIASYYKLDPVFICNPITGKHMVLPSTDSKVRSVNHKDLDGYLTFVEHKSNLMKLWRLTGKKIGDFFLCLEEIHDTHVKWNGWLSYAILGGLNRDHYLLEVRFLEGQQHPKTHITRFFPETRQYVHVDIPDIPVHFKATCFKPSLVCPLAAASRLS
ncbi:hypothetical protein F0562_023725 [Nyssa sinensis]|uniref:F-box domain-containing protein n=1 Tax=Nyssa sinensis TaxID=561372 RepID=A0A5J5BH89_9ASTE|nr:hypothetical protein F0562_023725 [Nyssa sinensis]